RPWLLAPIAAVILIVSIADLSGAIFGEVTWPDTILATHRYAGPFRSINPYGLFAMMTTTRPEIIIEGSDDGYNWREYEFKYKVGDVKRRPGFCQPHMPRLDWQMWFAALGDQESNPWFTNFELRLLQNQPAVMRLLACNPFNDHPPRYIRAAVYDYRITDPRTVRTKGEWWQRR